MKYLGVFLFVFSLTFVLLLVPKIGADVQTFVILDEDYNTDKAKLFPFIIGAFLLIISIIIIIKEFIIKAKVPTNDSPKINLQKVKDVSTLIIISLIYIILLEPIGFFIMTPICLVIYSWVFGSRKWFGFIVLPILITVFVYLCFELLMKVQLPKGILEWMFY